MSTTRYSSRSTPSGTRNMSLTRSRAHSRLMQGLTVGTDQPHLAVVGRRVPRLLRESRREGASSVAVVVDFGFASVACGWSGKAASSADAITADDGGERVRVIQMPATDRGDEWSSKPRAPRWSTRERRVRPARGGVGAATPHRLLIAPRGLRVYARRRRIRTSQRWTQTELLVRSSTTHPWRDSPAPPLRRWIEPRVPRATSRPPQRYRHRILARCCVSASRVDRFTHRDQSDRRIRLFIKMRLVHLQSITHSGKTSADVALHCAERHPHLSGRSRHV